MTLRQVTSHWKIILAAVLIAIIATLLFASYYPWLAMLIGLAMLSGGIAYAAWPPISEKIASLRSTVCPPLQIRIYVGAPIVVYGVVLLAIAQSQIRAGWRTADVHAEVAREIENANSALERERVEDALGICSALELKADADEKKQIVAIRERARAIENKQRAKAANNKVLQLVSDGRNHIIRRDIDSAQASLDAALQVPNATEFGSAATLANEVVVGRTKLATGFLDNVELGKAKEQLELAIAISKATETAEAKRLLADICNREVKNLVASARESVAKKNGDAAVTTLEKALAISGATETAEAEQMLAGIREEREVVANRKVASLLNDAEQRLELKQFAIATRILNEANAVPHSTKRADVATALQNVQKEESAEKDRAIAQAKEDEARRIATAERQEQKEAAAEAKRKAEEEYEEKGLVLLRKTLKGKQDEITGTVINRRKRELSYAQISFKLFDESGAQVGTALANINGLEEGGRWNFKATTFFQKYSTFKIHELTGF